MARPRRFEQDVLLTEMLDIEDVIALDHPKADDDNIYATLDDFEFPVCKYCKKNMRNHDIKEKEFLDVIEDNEGKHYFIKLHYLASRYRCVTPGCRNVVTKEIRFADLKARTTYRAEAYIVNLAMTYSYRNIEKMIAWNVSDDWEERYCDEVLLDKDRKITAQGIGAVIKRWVANKDAERQFITPEVLGLRTCDSGIANYIIAYNAAKLDNFDKSDVCVIEVLKEVSIRVVDEFLDTLCKEQIKFVHVDFNETLINEIRQQLPNAVVMISTDVILESIIKDFSDYLRVHMKQMSHELKEAMLGDPGLITAVQDTRLNEKFEQYAELNNAYHFVERLWDLILNENPSDDLQAWNTEMEIVCKEQFEYTAEYVETYWNEIFNYYSRREVLEGEAYEKLKRLDEAMRVFKNFSTDILRAKILYLGTTRDEPSQWDGIEVESIIEKIKQCPTEQRRIKHYDY